MPTNEAHMSALRQSGYVARVYFSPLIGQTVITGTITAVPTYPAKALAISITTGNIARVRRGFRVVIRSASGKYKGTVTVRMGGTMTNILLPIRETGRGWIQFAIGDTFTVYADAFLVDKLVENTPDFKPDGLSVGILNAYPALIPCSGGAWVGWLGADDTVDVPMFGHESELLSGNDPDHYWYQDALDDVDDYVTDTDPIFTYTEAGCYTVVHRVRDSVGGIYREQYIPVRVHSDDDPPYECTIGAPNADESFGWSLPVTPQGPLALDIDTLPNYTPVVLWVDGQDFGADVDGRSNQLMVGYLRRETVDVTAGTVEFEVISPLAAYAELLGLSRVMLNDPAADHWFKIDGLTFKTAIIHLIANYTWLSEAGYDVIFNGFDDAAYPALFVEENNPLDQLRDLASGRAGRVVCKKTGRIEIQGELKVIPLADRNDLDVTYTIEPVDVSAENAMTFRREHVDPVSTVHARGTLAGLTEQAALYAKWPESPGTGSGKKTFEKFAADDLAQFYAWAAMYGAAENGIYMDEEGTRQRAPSASLTFRGAYWAIFDFHREFIRFNGFGPDSNPRGIDLDGFRWIFKGASLDLDGGTFDTTITLQAETAGTGAADDTPISEDQLGLPDYTDPGDIYPPLPLPDGWDGTGGIDAALERIGFVGANGIVGLTETYQRRGIDGGPLWWAALDLGEPIQSAVQMIGTPGTILAAGDEHIFKITGLGSGSPSATSVHTFADGAPSGVRRVIDSERAAPNTFLVMSYHPSFGMKCAKTTDGGTSWAETVVSAYTDSPVITGNYDALGTHDLNGWTVLKGTYQAGSPNKVHREWGGVVGTSHESRIRLYCTGVLTGYGGTFSLVPTRFPQVQTGLGVLIDGGGAEAGLPGGGMHFSSSATITPVTVESYVEVYIWAASENDDAGCYADIEAIRLTFASDSGGAGGGVYTPVLQMRPLNAGEAYTIALNSSHETRAHKTSNSGGSWSVLSSPALNVQIGLGNILEQPYSDQSVFYTTRRAIDGSYELIRVSGTTITPCSPVFGGATYSMPGFSRRELAIADANRLNMVLLASSGADDTNVGLWRSRTGAASWDLVVAPGAALSIVEIAGDGRSVYLMGDGYAGYSGDLLDTLDDRSGNLASLSAGAPVRLFGWTPS